MTPELWINTDDPSAGVNLGAEASALEERLIDCARACWADARGARGNELRGRFVKRFDERGLHPFSFLWGQLTACAIMLGLPPESGWDDPLAFLRAAKEDAEQAFAAEVAERGADVFHRAKP